MDEEIPLTNREKSLLPKKSPFYCRCDRTMISKGQKCPICGNREKRREMLFVVAKIA